MLTRDFDGIGLAMLRRFQAYKDQVERLIEAERKPRHRRPNRHPDRISQPVPEATLNIVHAFVLNDYGNARLCYFHQRGDDSCLQRAINIYKKAAQMNPSDASPWFNLQNAYGWAGDPDDSIKECYERARQLAPTWTSVAIAAAKDRATTLFERLDREQREERPDDREITPLEKEFTHARYKALEEIRQHTKLAPLLDGAAEQQVDRLVSIPWRKLDEQDIETMVHLAELLAHGDPSEEQQAVRLAGHLLELVPEDYRVTDVLLNLAKRPPRHDQTHRSVCGEENLRLVRNQRQQIIDKWVETDPQNFLSIYWWHVNLEEQNCTSKFIDNYIWKQHQSSQAQDAIIKGMEQIRTQFFSDGPDKFENLVGWVYFRRGKYAEAAAAFGRAVSMQPTAARYQFDLGQCREQMGDWEAARAAYCAARRLDSQATEYAEGLASTLNQIGNQCWREDQFADAAANYQEAVSLAPEEAVYVRNLALAREHAKFPDEMTALSSAITEMQRAVEAAHHRPEYRDQLMRLKTRLAALQCYRPTPHMNRPNRVARSRFGMAATSRLSCRPERRHRSTAVSKSATAGSNAESSKPMGFV